MARSTDKNASKVEEKQVNENKIEEKKEDINKEEILGDIMANNPLSDPKVKEEEEIRAFTKKDVIQTTEFSWFRLDEYLNFKYQNISRTTRLFVECLVITFLFMIFPFATLLVKHGKKVFSALFKALTSTDTPTSIDNFVRLYLFFTSIYILYAVTSLFSENILYINLYFLDLIKMPIDEFVIEILQVVRSTNYYWSTSLTFFMIFLSYDYIVGTNGGLQRYKWILTLVLWYGCLMGILFIEKFFMNFCTAEIRRNEYRGRIWDINYKTFVFKKLVAISKVSDKDRKNLGENMNNEFDPGFYIKHNDLKFSTKKDADDIVESIFAYLNVQHISYKNLQVYFPDNHKEVYEYLANKKMKDDDKFDSIKYERIKDEATNLLTERNNMIKTLSDRESIFNKLDLILQSGAIYFSILLLAILFGIDYKVYLASIGPAFLTFGWVFSDTIKEIYNCFIFLLVKHPYDIGDRVIIDNKEYVVARTDVLSSTFTDCNGKLVYIPTPVLFNKAICNIRRSRKQSELLTILVNKSTTFLQATKLRDNLSKKLLEKQDIFTGTVTIHSFEGSGDNISISLFVQHTSNFQYINDKLRRRELCTDIIQKCLQQTMIDYLNGFKYED